MRLIDLSVPVHSGMFHVKDSSLILSEVIHPHKKIAAIIANVIQTLRE